MLPAQMILAATCVTPSPASTNKLISSTTHTSGRLGHTRGEKGRRHAELDNNVYPNTHEISHPWFPGTGLQYRIKRDIEIISRQKTGTVIEVRDHNKNVVMVDGSGRL